MLKSAAKTRLHIGQRIRTRRERLGILQRELGARLGTDQTQVSGWESGRRVIRMEDAIAIAQALHTTVGYLAGERPAGPVPATPTLRAS